MLRTASTHGLLFVTLFDPDPDHQPSISGYHLSALPPKPSVVSSYFSRYHHCCGDPPVATMLSSRGCRRQRVLETLLEKGETFCWVARVSHLGSPTV
ncbi:hypothetical protein V6N11_037721 [Hibiscus sabdariffa]|uniref:Uncharacterized protein n=1 Tax=Hibiscus sabdariffa TaxID=183260 RepID=A0ABR2PC46_9ROSI